MTRAKRRNTIALRVDDETLAELDEYQREREIEARAPLTRGLVLLEIIEKFIGERRAAPPRRARSA